LALTLMRTDFYRSLYDDEWTRRAEIRQAAALPTGILVLIAGVLAFYVRNYSFPSGGFGRVAFLAGVAVAALAFGVAIYMVARALFGPKYVRIPWPSQLRDYEEGLIAFYRAKEDGDTLAAQDWGQFLIDRFVAAANRNAANNANSGEYIYKANRAVVVSLVGLALAAIPLLIDLRSAENAPYHVEITNLGDLRYDRLVELEPAGIIDSATDVPETRRTAEADTAFEHRDQNGNAGS